MPPFHREHPGLTRVVAAALAGAILSSAYVLLAPKWYRSVLTVVSARQQRPGVSSLVGGDFAGLASGLDASLGGGAEVPRIAAVLQSVAVSDAVIARFQLKERYKAEYEETARDTLWGHCAVTMLPKPGLVELSCEDKDPRFAQQMVECFAEYGNVVFRRVSASSASEEVRFLEKRVVQLRTAAEDATTRVREFQERHGIVDLDTQSRALVSALSTLNAQRINKQLELDFARTFSSGDETTLQQLSSQLAVMDNKMRDLQSSAEPGATAPKRDRRNAAAPGVFPAALDVPKLRAEFEALYRERKVSEATLVFALERLESARANEARDTSTFVVLDPPTLPTRHDRPKRSLIVLVFTLLAGLAAAGVEWTRKAGGVAKALVALMKA